MLRLVPLSDVDVALVAASPQMDSDSFLPPSPWGLAGTTDPHLPTSPMSSSGSATGSETLRSSCLTGQRHLQAGGWGLDPAQCPMSSWAAGLGRLCLGLLIHFLGAIIFLFLGFTEPLLYDQSYLMNLLTLTSREVRVTPQSTDRELTHREARRLS